MPAVISLKEAIFSAWISCAWVVFSSDRVFSTSSFSFFNSFVRSFTLFSRTSFSFFNAFVRHLMNAHTSEANKIAYNVYAHHVCHHGGNTTILIDFSRTTPSLV